MSFIFLDEQRKVQVTEDGLTLPPVKELYDKDESKDKSSFYRALTYVYYVYNPDGVFCNKLPDERKRITCNTYLEGVDPSKFEESKFVKPIIDLYKELSFTPARQLYERIKIDIQEVQKILSEISYTKEIKVKVETEVEIEVDTDDGPKMIKVPVNKTVPVVIDNSEAKAKAIQNTNALFKQEKELRAMVEKESMEQKIRLRRKFDAVH